MYRKETITSTSSSSATMQSSSFMETSHVTKIVTTGGVTDEKRHSTSATSTSQVKTATGQPTMEVHGSHMQEVKQEGAGPAVVSEKVNFVKKEGEKITQQIEHDSRSDYAVPLPSPKRIVTGKRKIAPARFVQPLSGVIAKEGDRVALECTIEGHPEPEVTWTCNGMPLSGDAEITSQFNKVSLVLPNVDQSHAGKYTCVIKNEGGMAQCTCDVIIKKSQFPPVISKRLQPVIVNGGERLYLEIDVSGTPAPTVIWSKDGSPIYPSDHTELRSEGTRHILIIQQAAIEDSGRYSALATNAAGRAESLADVRITPVVQAMPPPTHKIVFTDTVDEAKSITESIEDGHTKTVKRAIEEVTVEASSPPSPAKALKPQPKPKPLPIPPNYQASSPESATETEEEVRRPPGKLKKCWPPLPTEEDEEEEVKSSPAIEVRSQNISSIISSFSSLTEETQTSGPKPPKVPAKPKPKPVLAPLKDVDIEMQPEPAPEYGYISPQSPKSPEFFLAPESPPEYGIIKEPSPEYILAPESKFEPVPMETDMSTQSTFFTSEVKQEYNATISSVDSSKILSPIPEAASEYHIPVSEQQEMQQEPSEITPGVATFPITEPVKLLTPEPLKESSLEPPKDPTPEPLKVLTPEPPKEPTPEPPNEPTPEPPREPTPEPPREPTPEPPREPTPEPPREPTPEPIKEPTPEPIKEPTPEPPREPTPEPPKEPTPEPPRELTPEPPREPTPEPPREPTPEPLREPTPEPPREPTPEPPREPTPEPLKEPTPEPQREPTPELKEPEFETQIEPAHEPLKEPLFEIPKEQTPEPQKSISPITEIISTEPQILRTEEVVFEVTPQACTYSRELPSSDDQPALKRETTTETTSTESNFLESKKSISKSSFTTMETKVYTTGISGPPIEQYPEDSSTMQVDEAFHPKPPVYQAFTPKKIKTEDYTMASYIPETSNYDQPCDTSNNISSSQMTSFLESNQMQTMFVTSSNVQNKIYAQLPPVEPVLPTVFSALPSSSLPPITKPKSERQPLKPLIMPEPKQLERAISEEVVKPPKHPEREDGREPKKHKKKRESVIQLAKRLEETIIPMSPDEVPGGIRMFPSPKQPSTPVRESPTPVRETASGRVTPVTDDESSSAFKLERFPELAPFPFSVESKPKRERPRSLPPPAPRKFVAGSGFTDSEYESDMESEVKKYKYETPIEVKYEEPIMPIPDQPLESENIADIQELMAPLVIPAPSKEVKEVKADIPVVIPKPRTQSLDRKSLPFALGGPPPLEGGMRPSIIQKEEIVMEKKEPPKSITPRKNSKIVEKFLAAAGPEAAEEITRPVPKKTKKVEPIKGPEIKSSPVEKPPTHKTEKPPTPKAEKPSTPKMEKPKAEVFMQKQITEEINIQKPSPKAPVNIDTRGLVTPSKMAKVKQISESTYSETNISSSVSYQKMESTTTKQHIQKTSESHEVISKPQPPPVFKESPTIPVYEQPTETQIGVVPEIHPEYVKESSPIISPQPLVELAAIIHPSEPTPVYIPEPVPEPVICTEIPEVALDSVHVVEPEPTINLVPEPEPTFSYIPEPESIPSPQIQKLVLEPEPEPEPQIITDPEPIPEPKLEPLYITEPESELEPEPEPEPETEPEPEPEPEPILVSAPTKELEPTTVSIPEPDISRPISTAEPVLPSTPGFKSVRAPTPKRGQTPAKSTSAPAPPPPFDMTPPVLDKTPKVEYKPDPTPIEEPEPIVKPTPIAEPKPIVKPAPLVEPKPIVKPTPLVEAKATPKPKQFTESKSAFKVDMSQKAEIKSYDSTSIKSVSEKLVKTEENQTVIGAKKIPAGSHKLPVWPPVPTEPAKPVSMKTRSQSAERPPVTEAPPQVVRPHEAPPSVIWSSSVTIQEKRKSWPQPTPQVTPKISTKVYESTFKTSTEQKSEVSKLTSESSIKKEVKICEPILERKLTPINPVSQRQPTPVAPDRIVSPVLSPTRPAPEIKSPPLVSPTPPIPDIKSPPLVSPPPSLSDLTIPPIFTKPQQEKQVYHPIHRVPKIEPRKETKLGIFTVGEKPKGPSKDATISTIIPMPPLEPFPFSTEPEKTKKSRGRAPSVPKKFVPTSFTESEYESDFDSATSPIFRPYMSDSETPGFRPLNIRMKRGRSMQPRKASPPAPSTLGLPEPFDESLSHTASSFIPQPIINQSKHIIQTVKRLASQVTPESKLSAVPKKEVPVVAPTTIPKVTPVIFQQAPSVITPTTEYQSGHVIRTSEQKEKGVKSIKKRFEAGGQISEPHVPLATTVPGGSSVTMQSVHIATESDASSIKKKPASPKARKKVESTQMSAVELEESGYAADTESTLPRRGIKSTQSSSTSFSKSETSMSSSYSKTEHKSFSSSESNEMSSSGFSVGYALDRNIPFKPFAVPTSQPSSVGQTSHISSSFKSTESKSSQMFTSRSEETHEEKREEKDTKPTKSSPPPEKKQPKFEEFRHETHGTPGSYGPFSEDSYYSMRDESDVSDGSSRTQKKVEVKSETHVQVMSDKKVEVFETTSFDVSPKVEKKVFMDEVKKPEKETQEVKEEFIQKKTAHSKVSTSSQSSKTTFEREYIVKDGETTLAPKPITKTVIEPKVSQQIKTTIESKIVNTEPLKSTGLVKQAVIKQEQTHVEPDLKPFPFKPESEKNRKPRGTPPTKPSKFIKGETKESDYESDYEGRIPAKWKPADSDAEDQQFNTVKPSLSTPKESKPKERTPTPPTVFDKPPAFDGPPRPKVDFPESETEPEKEFSPEIVIPEKIETVPPVKTPIVTPKEPKIFKSQPVKKEVPRPPSPVLKPGTPPQEDYIEPPPKPQPKPKPQVEEQIPVQPSPFANAVGVESTKITKIADSSKYHSRFVSMQQTTRVIKFTDGKIAKTVESEDQSKLTPQFKYHFEEKEPLPALEPFPYTPDATRARKDRGQAPPKPKKFQKGEFTESDYDSDYEGRIKPKWQPTDSDTEDFNYSKVKPKLRADRTPSKTRERTPTPPTEFDVPPESIDGPWRPVIDKADIIIQKELTPDIIVPKIPPTKSEVPKKVIAKVPEKIVQPPERPESPPLPSPGPTPEEGFIAKEIQYVVDKVDVKSKINPLEMVEYQTYEDKPFTKVTERTEKTLVQMKVEEELRMKKEKSEQIKTTVIEYEDAPARPPPPVEIEIPSLEKFQNLEPFPYEAQEPKPKRDRGQLPSKPNKFVKGDFRESDYDSDYEGRIKPRWKPADSDVEDPEYTPVRPPPPSTKQLSVERDRTPTPPTKFDVPPPVGGPLRPAFEHIPQPVEAPKETTPEVIIPKVEKLMAKTPKITPKAPIIKPVESKPIKPHEPTPPLPEPGPQPEIGYIKRKIIPPKEEEDVHLKMIKKKIESKKAFEIDIDITDIYDFVSESEQDKTDTEISIEKQLPKLEPFPYEPEPDRPKRQRGPPPPHPKKFHKGEFRGSDYESDYDAPIVPKWAPCDSEGETHAYRKVAPPASEIGRQRSESTGKEPSPPSKFDHPPQFEGPPRPVMDLSDIPRRERRESLEEYSIPRFPLVEFKPFDVEDEVTISRTKGGITTDTETETETHVQVGVDSKYAKSAQNVVSHQFEDMTQTFRHKAQKFAEQLVTEVFAAREGSEPAEPAGEPPSLPEELKTCSVSPDSTAAPSDPKTAEVLSPTYQEPQAYRDESRISEFGTKHIDPDTGLIYFKYDFGYEFGVILPGEAKKVEKKKKVNGDINGDMNGDISIPVIHEKSSSASKSKSSKKANGHIASMKDGPSQDLSATTDKGESSSKDIPPSQEGVEQFISPQPSVKSDTSETDREYQQYMGKMVPEFVPKKQAQFRPISGDPYSDSDGEADHISPSKLSETSPRVHTGPKRFVPLVPGAAVQPKTIEGSPTDPVYTSSELGASSRSNRGRGRASKTGVRGASGSSRPGHVGQRGRHPPERTRLPDSLQKRGL